MATLIAGTCTFYLQMRLFGTTSLTLPTRTEVFDNEPTNALFMQTITGCAEESRYEYRLFWTSSFFHAFYHFPCGLIVSAFRE